MSNLTELLRCESLPGCDRKEVATAIGTVGYSNRDSDTAAGSWHAGFAPPEDVANATGTHALTPLDSAWNELQEMRSQVATGEPVDAKSIDSLILRLDSLIRDYEKRSTSQVQLRSARDAKLTALSIGAATHTDKFAARRDHFYRELFQAEYDRQTAANLSVQHLVTNHLAQSKLDSQAFDSLARHVTAHPDCEMNVQLYLTTVERLANEDQIAVAIQVGSQGVQLCASHSKVSELTSQVNRLRSQHADLPGNIMQFTSPTLRGRRFDLRSKRGSLVLVVFWATWCPACVQEVPYIKQLEQRYHPEGLEIIGVSLDSDRQKLAEFVAEQKISWPQMFSNHPGNTGWKNPIAQHYDIHSIPEAFLIDSNGAIVGAHLHGRQAIEKSILNQLSK